jgi:branched-chain amino acid transport system ATP-binding protein
MEILSANNLNKTFGGLWAVRDFNFFIERREIVGLIGPNGAGKTTVFNLLSGFYKPDNGSILFNGENITNLKPYEICKKGVARTFQLVKPFDNLTVHHNIRIAAYNTLNSLKGAEEATLNLLNLLGMSNKRDYLAKDLTIAERKRLELGRSLATRPNLLLLDEVMAGLNSKEVNDIIDLIYKISDMGITIFIIEHIMKAIMTLSQRVIVLNYGQKICEGKPEEISRNKKVIEAYLGEDYGIPES